MKIIENKKEQITFEVEMNETLANAIRRYMNRIFVIAVEEVEILNNDSALHDETLAHRIGMIPLKSDSANEKTTGKLKLTPKGEGIIYSGELTGSVEIVYNKIPIVFLKEGQKLEILATVRSGKGIEHAKFSPGLLFYRPVLEISMDKSLADKIKKICPKNEIKEKGDKIIVIDNQRKEILDVCEGICEKNNKKAESKQTDELIITIESFGQIGTKKIFEKSVEALKKDLAEVAKKVSK